MRRWVLTALFWNLVSAEQTVLQTEPKHVSTAPFIFNSLSGLLTQWPNTVHPNGHSIVPGILHPFTLLYHAREDPDLPPSPEWLAYDPEMSFAIMVTRGGPTYLATYRTLAPANVVYFDGMSAAWGPGWLDSQHMFLYGASPDANKDIQWWDDYGRAEKLCEWAKARNVDGIVRMNAGFEVIWCDFSSPKLQLVSHLNITPPGTPEASKLPRWPPGRFHDIPLFDEDERPERVLDRAPPGEDDRRPPPRGPGGGERGPPRRPSRPRISELALTSNLEWVRAASHRSFSPQPHLTVFPAGMVTYYHPRLTSLLPDRKADRNDLPMRAHRLVNISDNDARSVVEEFDSVLARSFGNGSGMDWTGTALSIVEYWGTRVSHMHALLLNASEPTANITASLPSIRTLAYTLINPYMQPGSYPDASGWELFFGSSGVGNVTALDRCIHQTTAFLSELKHLQTPQEALLQESIETVLKRLCNDFGTIFAESSDLVQQPIIGLVLQWLKRIEALMQWLDWSVWLRCNEVCPRDYVCSTPVWPIAWMFRRPGEETDDDLKPRCIRMAV
ncbi:hypothetical protein MKEN_01061900 [Mycena kentingensis (nom. inval.)]|nr:hypothetical protein MKEN_01061900 [Mycena kentingensis (nom. inval.)]